MDNKTVEVYNLLAKHSLQEYFSAFTHILNVYQKRKFTHQCFFLFYLMIVVVTFIIIVYCERINRQLQFKLFYFSCVLFLNDKTNEVL